MIDKLSAVSFFRIEDSVVCHVLSMPHIVKNIIVGFLDPYNVCSKIIEA